MLANIDPTTTGMLIAAVTSMGTAVTYLHKSLVRQMSEVNDQWRSQMEEVKKALIDCQLDREAMWALLARQAGTDVDSLRKEKEADK
jgi:hypothetical protein